MKKFSLLIILIFLTSCIATNTGPETMAKANVQKGASKLSVKDNFFLTTSWDDPFWVGARDATGKKHYYDPDRNIEILYPKNKSIFLVFTKVTMPVYCEYWPCQYGDGFYDSTHYSLNAALDYVDSKFGKSTSSEQLSFTTSIGKHKNTCKELGFTPGTEKFGDCALKLIELEVAQQGNNKAVQQIQIIKQQPAYDHWMGELGLSILRGDFNKKVQQPSYRFPTNQRSICRWQSGGIGQPYMTCITR